MEPVVIAPDSFKGSLDAGEVAERMAAGLTRAMPGVPVLRFPMADGGEGTAAVLTRALGGSWRELELEDANGQLRVAPFGCCKSTQHGRFAVLDVAEIIGLPDAVAAPKVRTTTGVGQAIRAMAMAGFRTIVIGLGGSSTMDAGAGLLAELALELRDASGAAVRPTFGSLARIRDIALKPDTDWLEGVRLIGITDVRVALSGPQGAAYVFGPQKGFDVDLARADRTLTRFAEHCERVVGRAARDVPGAGAAGGIGFALAVLGGELLPGAEFLAQAQGLAEAVRGARWVLTGEGRSDGQTMLGKAPSVVADIARDHDVPVTLLSGSLEADPGLDAGFDGCFSVLTEPCDLEAAMEMASERIEMAAYQLGKLFRHR